MPPYSARSRSCADKDGCSDSPAPDPVGCVEVVSDEAEEEDEVAEDESEVTGELTIEFKTDFRAMEDRLWRVPMLGDENDIRKPPLPREGPADRGDPGVPPKSSLLGSASRGPKYNGSIRMDVMSMQVGLGAPPGLFITSVAKDRRRIAFKCSSKPLSAAKASDGC